MNRYFTAFLLFCLSLAGHAQSTGPEMADTFRQEGKIYVVIAVIAVIFISLLIFLLMLERRINRIERRIAEHKPEKTLVK